MIEHRNLVNLCAWQNSYHRVTAADSAAAYSGFGFDASVWEIFPFLTAGATLHIIAEDIRLSPEQLNQYFEDNAITITNLPTQLCEQFMEMTDNRSLKTLVTGGDKLKSYRRRNYRLVNEYGPTEYTISSTYFQVDRHYDNIPIGRPLGNTWAYVLDRHSHPQPAGVPGELCIAGAQTARGYLNRPDLTLEKFVPNPFVTGEENSRMYRTGDLVRWLPDGNIEFLGRIDQQVKIRGYRIELGEIEQQLIKHPEIKDAVVIDLADSSGGRYLCAYLVSERELSAAELKTYLGRELPGYMIPSHFLRMESIPLTANGKVDKRSLPAPDISKMTVVEYASPRNQIEWILAEVWQEVLGVQRVGINDNFFSLGGDSIKAIQVISRLGRHSLKLEMKNIFQNPTIGEVSRQVQRTERIVRQEPVQGEIGLTPIQQWFFKSSFTDMHHWNQSTVYYASKGFDPLLVESVFKKLVWHHDALRMIYRFEDVDVAQYNRGPGEGRLFTLNVVEVSEGQDLSQIIKRQAENAQKGIELSTGPLVNLALVKHREGDYLIVVIHHLVVDGVSWRILSEDFFTAYEQALKNEQIALPQKTDSFRDWSEKVREYANGREMIREAACWRVLEGCAVSPLPIDNLVEGVKRLKDNDSLEFCLSAEDTEKLLKGVNKAYNTEINDILLAGLGLALKKWAGLDKVLITLEGHGREDIIKDIDITRTVGWFTATYPVLLDSSADDISSLVKATKENLRLIPNKGIGYEILKYLTSPENKKDLGFNLEPEIEFNYLGNFDDDAGQSGITVCDVSAGEDMSPQSEMQHFKLIISSVVRGGNLKVAVEYNRHEYNPDTIKRFTGYYSESLTNIIEHCAARDETEFTQSDLGDATLTAVELEKIYQLCGKDIQSIYPLTPMQEGMLFMANLGRDSGAYFEQSYFTVKGRIDPQMFEENFNHMLQRHDVLRTVFIYEGISRPRQVVLKEKSSKIFFSDISELNQEAKIKFIEDLKIKDVRAGFDLSRDMLIRLCHSELSPHHTGWLVYESYIR